jgi:hypothetical protein
MILLGIIKQLHSYIDIAHSIDRGKRPCGLLALYSELLIKYKYSYDTALKIRVRVHAAELRHVLFHLHHAIPLLFYVKYHLFSLLTHAVSALSILLIMIYLTKDYRSVRTRHTF